MGTQRRLLWTFVGCWMWILHELGTAFAVPTTTEGQLTQDERFGTDEPTPFAAESDVLQGVKLATADRAATSADAGNSPTPFPPGFPYGEANIETTRVPTHAQLPEAHTVSWLPAVFEHDFTTRGDEEQDSSGSGPSPDVTAEPSIAEAKTVPSTTNSSRSSLDNGLTTATPDAEAAAATAFPFPGQISSFSSKGEPDAFSGVPAAASRFVGLDNAFVAPVPREGTEEELISAASKASLSPSATETELLGAAVEGTTRAAAPSTAVPLPMGASPGMTSSAAGAQEETSVSSANGQNEVGAFTRSPDTSAGKATEPLLWSPEDMESSSWSSLQAEAVTGVREPLGETTPSIAPSPDEAEGSEGASEMYGTNDAPKAAAPEPPQPSSGSRTVIGTPDNTEETSTVAFGAGEDDTVPAGPADAEAGLYPQASSSTPGPSQPPSDSEMHSGLAATHGRGDADSSAPAASEGTVGDNAPQSETQPVSLDAELSADSTGAWANAGTSLRSPLEDGDAIPAPEGESSGPTSPSAAPTESSFSEAEDAGVSPAPGPPQPTPDAEADVVRITKEGTEVAGSSGLAATETQEARLSGARGSLPDTGVETSSSAFAGNEEATASVTDTQGQTSPSPSGPAVSPAEVAASELPAGGAGATAASETSPPASPGDGAVPGERSPASPSHVLAELSTSGPGFLSAPGSLQPSAATEADAAWIQEGTEAVASSGLAAAATPQGGRLSGAPGGVTLLPDAGVETSGNKEASTSITDTQSPTSLLPSNAARSPGETSAGNASELLVAGAATSAGLAPSLPSSLGDGAVMATQAHSGDVSPAASASPRDGLAASSVLEAGVTPPAVSSGASFSQHETVVGPAAAEEAWGSASTAATANRGVGMSSAGTPSAANDSPLGTALGPASTAEAGTSAGTATSFGSSLGGEGSPPASEALGSGVTLRSDAGVEPSSLPTDVASSPNGSSNAPTSSRPAAVTQADAGTEKAASSGLVRAEETSFSPSAVESQAPSAAAEAPRGAQPPGALGSEAPSLSQTGGETSADTKEATTSTSHDAPNPSSSSDAELNPPSTAELQTGHTGTLANVGPSPPSSLDDGAAAGVLVPSGAGSLSALVSSSETLTELSGPGTQNTGMVAAGGSGAPVPAKKEALKSTSNIPGETVVASPASEAEREGSSPLGGFSPVNSAPPLSGGEAPLSPAATEGRGDSAGPVSAADKGNAGSAADSQSETGPANAPAGETGVLSPAKAVSPLSGDEPATGVHVSSEVSSSASKTPAEAPQTAEPGSSSTALLSSTPSSLQLPPAGQTGPGTSGLLGETSVSSSSAASESGRPVGLPGPEGGNGAPRVTALPSVSSSPSGSQFGSPALISKSGKMPPARQANGDLAGGSHVSAAAAREGLATTPFPLSVTQAREDDTGAGFAQEGTALASAGAGEAVADARGQATAPAVPLYPYGAKAKDKEYVERRVDFNSRLFKPVIGFPFGKTLRDALYFTDNGQIIFPASDNEVFPYPNPPPEGFNGRETVPMVAVFWDNADFSRGVATTFYQEFMTLNSAKPPFIQDVEAKIRRYVGRSYSAVWTLKITWVKAPAYPAWRDVTKTNTYQAVLTTDGVKAYVLILYQDGSMQWDYTRRPAANVLIGYSSGDGSYQNDNLTQSPPAAKYRPDQFRGYGTDLRGLRIYKLDSRVRANYRVRCLSWAGKQQEPGTWNRGLPPCPCSLQQGESDGRFRRSKGGWLDAQVTMLYTASPSQHGAGVRCLYGQQNELVDGRQEKYWKYSRQASPFRDQELKLQDWCCNQTGSPRFCALYGQKRPKIGCDGYKPPNPDSAETSSEESGSRSEKRKRNHRTRKSA